MGSEKILTPKTLRLGSEQTVDKWLALETVLYQFELLHERYTEALAVVDAARKADFRFDLPPAIGDVDRIQKALAAFDKLHGGK